jgi:hypothetical protein
MFNGLSLQQLKSLNQLCEVEDMIQVDIKYGGTHLSAISRCFAYCKYEKQHIVACFSDDHNRQLWIEHQQSLDRIAGTLNENQASYRVWNDIASPLGCYAQLKSGPMSIDANVVYENKMRYASSTQNKKHFPFDGEYFPTSFPLRINESKEEREDNEYRGS